MKEYPWLDAYLLGLPGVTKDFKMEWQWERYLVGGKMFAAILCPDEKYHEDYAGKNLVNLKCDPMEAELLRKQYPSVLPGFYSDKRCWNSIDLEGGLPEEMICQMCKNSYGLVFQKLTKKLQKEILTGGSI